MLLADPQVGQNPPRLPLLLRKRAYIRARVEVVRFMTVGELLPDKPVTPLDLLKGKPILRDVFQNTPNQKHARVRHVRRHRITPVQNALLQLRNCFSSEGHEPGDDEVEQDAERPHVHVDAVVVLVLEQLGRGVGRRAAERVERVVGAGDGAEPEVAHLGKER